MAMAHKIEKIPSATNVSTRTRKNITVSTEPVAKKDADLVSQKSAARTRQSNRLKKPKGSPTKKETTDAQSPVRKPSAKREDEGGIALVMATEDKLVL